MAQLAQDFLKRPRLLPVTMAVMGFMLVWRSSTLVLAASSEASPAPIAAPSLPAPSLPAPGLLAPNQVTPSTVSQPALPPPVLPAASLPPDGSAGADAAAPSAGERQLLQDLRARRDAIDVRARALDTRAAIMAAAQSKLDERVHDLAALQTRLETLDTARRAHDAENWAGLVKIYEQMKPRDAAVIFDALDMPVLLGVLDRMQPRKIASVLAAMNPDRARLATQNLAAMRNRAVTLADTPAAAPPANLTAQP